MEGADKEDKREGEEDTWTKKEAEDRESKRKRRHKERKPRECMAKIEAPLLKRFMAGAEVCQSG